MGDLPKMSTWGTKGQKYEICDKEAREKIAQLKIVITVDTNGNGIISIGGK